MFVLYILFFLCLESSFVKSDGVVWCNGQMCMDNCTAIACKLCNPLSCGSASCRCPSTSIPGGLSVDKTPQFIYLTFEGPIKRYYFEVSNFTNTFLKNKNITDSNGCFVKPTFYVQNDYSDYNYVAYMSLIGSVGLNSITGKLNQYSTSLHWQTEYLLGKQWLYQYSQMTNTIYLSRAVNREYNTKYFDILDGIDIKIDSSLAENPFFNVTYDIDREQTQRLWPYTLDYGFHNQKSCANVTDNVTGITHNNCINKTYHGTWEFVQTLLTDPKGNTYDLNWVCAQNYTQAMTILKSNFEDNYKKNRAPFGLNISFLWLINEAEVDQVRLKFLQEAYDYMGNHTNSLFATEDRVLNWMKNPLSYAETLNMQEFSCIDKTLKDAFWREPLLCDFPTTVGAFYFNLVNCPEYYPNITNSICNSDQFCHAGIDDCSCEYCEPCVNNWPGDIYWNFTKEWTDGVCGRIIIANHLNYVTRSAIITMRLYNAYITRIWGANYVRINATEFPCKSETWRVVPYLREYLIDSTYSYVGICLHKGADFQRNLVRLGVEFSATYPLASRVQDWIVRSCGDGVCTDDELGINNKTLSCNADCLPGEIYMFLHGAIFRSGIYSIFLILAVLLHS